MLIDAPARPSAVPSDHPADTHILASGLARGHAKPVSHLRGAGCVPATLYELQMPHTRQANRTIRLENLIAIEKGRGTKTARCPRGLCATCCILR